MSDSEEQQLELTEDWKWTNVMSSCPTPTPLIKGPPRIDYQAKWAFGE